MRQRAAALLETVHNGQQPQRTVYFGEKRDPTVLIAVEKTRQHVVDGLLQRASRFQRQEVDSVEDAPRSGMQQRIDVDPQKRFRVEVFHQALKKMADVRRRI